MQSGSGNFKYIYGPVTSWRLGRSLGIDLLSGDKKVCGFNCTYCQLGQNVNYTSARKLYVPTEEIIRELRALPPVHIDYLTFSGSGEPTLAINLGETIKEIRKIRQESVAALTNGSLINRQDVQRELSLTDFVALKIDACSQKLLETINRPAPEIFFDNIIKGVKEFRKLFKGRLALQIMFTADNKDYAGELAELAREIKPDEVQLNTPLRPCPVKPLSPEEMQKIKIFFTGLNFVSVYDKKAKPAKPLSSKDTLKRRGAL